MKTNIESPAFVPDHKIQYKLSGFIAPYLQGITDQWLLIAPLANPAMLEMFRTRDAYPLRKMVAWSGEFAGKYLTSAVEVLRLTGDNRLRSFIGKFVTQLISFQDEDGYLGPWQSTQKLTGKAPNEAGSGLTWDAWGHYHILLGLLLWYDETGDQESLQAAIRIGDLFVDKFLGSQPGKRLVDTGSTEMNLAPVHGLALLYQREPKEAYLKLAIQLVDEFAATENGAPLAGDYYRQGLQNIPFYKTPKPRWESLHPIMGLAELYTITGESSYRTAFENLWWSMQQYDLHNNGGFTSGEQATGNPYHQGAIETCCTIAWLAMSVEMLKLTGNPLVADMIERSTLNQITGTHSITGRWATYNTPMDGVRNASAHTIVFQSNSGSPELNCCSVNSPRGFGMISDWAVMRNGENLVLNFYESGTISFTTSNGQSVQMVLDTRYPFSPDISIKIQMEEPATFPIKLRIPSWSKINHLSVNGVEQPQPKAGTYAFLQRTWQPGDSIDLKLDFTPYLWVGENECKNRTSIYRGPILLAFDQRYNMHINEPVESIQAWIEKAAGMPALDCQNLDEKEHTWDSWFPPALLLEYPSTSGEPVFLCDFASAGSTGAPYITWLKTTNTPQSTAYSQENLLHKTPAG